MYPALNAALNAAALTAFMTGDAGDVVRNSEGDDIGTLAALRAEIAATLGFGLRPTVAALPAADPAEEYYLVHADGLLYARSGESGSYTWAESPDRVGAIENALRAMALSAATDRCLAFDPNFDVLRAVGDEWQGHRLVPSHSIGIWDDVEKAWRFPGVAGEMPFDQPFALLDDMVAEGEPISATGIIEGIETGSARLRVIFLNDAGGEIGSYVSSATASTTAGSEHTVKVENLLRPAGAAAFRLMFQDQGGNFQFYAKAAWAVPGPVASDLPPVHRPLSRRTFDVSEAAEAQRQRIVAMVSGPSLVADPTYIVAHSAGAELNQRPYFDTNFPVGTFSTATKKWTVPAQSGGTHAVAAWFSDFPRAVVPESPKSVTAWVRPTIPVTDPDGARTRINVRAFAGAPGTNPASGLFIVNKEFRLFDGLNRITFDGIIAPADADGWSQYFVNGFTGDNASVPFEVVAFDAVDQATGRLDIPTSPSAGVIGALGVQAAVAEDELPPWKIVTPPRIYAVLGDPTDPDDPNGEVNVYNSLLSSQDYGTYPVEWDPGSVSFGEDRATKWTWRPDAPVADGTIAVSTLDPRSATGRRALDTAVIALTAFARSAAIGLTLNVHYLGDSFINTQNRVRQAKETSLANADGVQINLVGVDTSDGFPRSGFGGKDWADLFQKDAASFSGHPAAVNDGDYFSAALMTSLNSLGPFDTLVCPFGFNGVQALTDDPAARAAAMDQLSKMAAILGVSMVGANPAHAPLITSSFRSENPNLRIVIPMIAYGSDHADLYGSFGLGRSRGSMLRAVQIYNDLLVRLFGGREAEGIYVSGGSLFGDPVDGHSRDWDDPVHGWERSGTGDPVPPLDYAANPRHHMRDCGRADIAVLTYVALDGWTAA